MAERAAGGPDRYRLMYALAGWNEWMRHGDR
jgi:hypothetical protein